MIGFWIKKNSAGVSNKKFEHPLIIFESDDWGSIRMPSKEIYETIKNRKSSLIDDPYLKYDSLESEIDLEYLFNLLIEYKDEFGNPPCITANFLSQNPDFKAIKDSGYSEYYGESFIETFKRYPNCGQSYDIELRGIKEKIFFPQFHGREHIQISRWLDALRAKRGSVLEAFGFNMISLKHEGSLPCVEFYMDAFHPCSSENIKEINWIVKDGLQMFNKDWGFSSRSIIPPCYFWHNDLEESLINEDILGFQGIKIQKVSMLDGNPYNFKIKRRTLGKKNRYNQINLVRNAFFEPSLDPQKDWVNSCLKEVIKAVRESGIAIICIHRLNFIGSVFSQNRDHNLVLFKELLDKLLIKIPNLKFGTSVDAIERFNHAN